MKNMTINQVAQALNGEILGGIDPVREGLEATHVEIDSRLIKEGGIFIAVRGERSDGHQFLGDVAEKGALFAIVEKDQTELPDPLPLPYIRVDSTLSALEELAAFYRSQVECRVIGITGSVGKTSTKDFISTVLSEKLNVLATEGNKNNNIGLPLMVLKLRPEHDAAVLEMGISHFGEMTRLSKAAKPDIAVITNIGVSHMENLGSQNGIMEEKLHILDFMKEHGSLAVNGDDPLLRAVAGSDHAVSDKVKRIVTFGKGSGNDIRFQNVSSLGYKGSRAEIVKGSGVCAAAGQDDFLKQFQSPIRVEVPVPGEHMLYNATVAALMGSIFGLTSEEIIAGLSKVKLSDGRSGIIETERFTIIDDSYNASPDSMEAAFALATELPVQGRRVFILGDMFELGKDAGALHAKVGRAAARSSPDLIICIGELSRKMADEAVSMIGREKVGYFDSVDLFLEKSESFLRDKDTILVKASHGMEFARIVKALKDKGIGAAQAGDGA